MRFRWIRTAGLGPAFLAAVLLAVSPVLAAAAETQRGGQGAFWDQQARWFDQSVGKALRATPEQNRWEVLVGVEKDGEWNHDGYFDEVFRRRPASSKSLDPAVKTMLDSLGTVILIGEVRASRGSSHFVVAAVLEEDSSLQDSDGQTLKRFIPLHVNESYQGALRFAQTYEKFYDGTLATGETLSPQGSFEKPLGCVQICDNKRQANLSACGVQFTLCGSAANAALLACALSCGGIPVCEGICAAAYLLWLASCTADYIGCQSTAEQIWENCVNNCPEGPGCIATATHTVTSTISLETDTALGHKLVSRPVNFALSRAEMRGEQSFVMDEWAIVNNGLVKASSNPAFGLAVAEQGAAPAGWSLVVQEPVHDMNSRHVPKPGVRISSTRLARSEKGKGEVVVARLELSSSTDVDRAEILYTSKPMEKTRLEQLVSRRVSLAFESEKEHRTAVYVVFRLTDRLEVLSTHTAFPKCCCGGEFCA